MTTCLICGCTDTAACVDEGEACHWIVQEDGQGICSTSACIRRAEQLGWLDPPEAPALLAPSSELILPGDPDFHL